MYKTYLRSKFDPNKISNITNHGINKPFGGLWGCRGDEWKDWCETEDFRKVENPFYWELTEDANVLEIRTAEDFNDVVKRFRIRTVMDIDCIDWETISKQYDGVEVFSQALYETSLSRDFSDTIFLIGLSSWDIPSICVWNADKIKLME